MPPFLPVVAAGVAVDVMVAGAFVTAKGVIETVSVRIGAVSVLNIGGGAESSTVVVVNAVVVAE